jgi:hypothetical protein
MRIWRNTTAALFVLLGASQVIAQEREWSLDAANEDVFMMFGVPATEDVGVSFWCKRGTQRVSLFAPLPGSVKQVTPKQVTLGVNGKNYVLKTEPAAEVALQSVEAALSPQQDLLSTLGKADTFSLEISGHVSTYPLEGADFTNLVKLCSESSQPEE